MEHNDFHTEGDPGSEICSQSGVSFARYFGESAQRFHSFGQLKFMLLFYSV